MNLALIVPEFPPDVIGGGGTVFEGLATTLTRRGHRVRILTSSTRGGPAGDDRQYAYPILRVAQFQHFTTQFRTYMPPLPLRLRGVRKFLSGADIYHFHGYGTIFIDTIFNFFVPSKRCVFTSHGFPHTVPAAGGPLALAYSIYEKTFGSRILKKSARLTAVSNAVAKQVEAASGRTATVIPNGFTSFERADEPGAAISSELSKGPYALGVGRLEELKGFHYAIRALAALRARGSSLRLVLAGQDNGYQKHLQALARDLRVETSVSFLGAVPRSQLARVYRQAVCSVVSSKTESFSLVMLEAMSCGVPCVASAVGGILDIASNGENALLYESENVPALTERIQNITASPELREKLIAGGRATIERFSWERVAAQYEQVYSSL